MKRLALISVVCGSAALAQNPTPPYFTSAQSIPATRACLSEAFTLEKAFWAPAFSPGFKSAMETALVPAARWFGCVGSSLACRHRAVLTPVLPDRSFGAAVPLMRRDGHLRSYLVTFEWLNPLTSTWTRATVRPERSCEVVSAIRATAATTLGVSLSCRGDPSGPCTTQPAVLVARSCGATAQDVEAVLPASTLNWAPTRIGVPTTSAAPVDVALVDTGIPPEWHSALGVLVERALPTFETGARAPFHAHGVHMASLIRSVAPKANLWSYRALDRNGHGSLSSVAHAVDDALFDNGRAFSRTTPLVVNLSVGAPPEFLRPAPLTGVGAVAGETCSTWEDGAGETLRYVLAVAGELDAVGPAVFIAASSGNSVLEKATTTSALSENRGLAQTPCSGVTASPLQSSFLPAAFGEHASCRPTPRWPPVLPVGATTFADVPSTITLASAMPFMMAPGERVYANAPGLPRAGATADCGLGFVGRSRGMEMPASVTGTSASSAFVAGAAARLLGEFPAGPSTPWRASSLARVLYVTGQPLCRSGVSQPQRRLDLKRAGEVLRNQSAACVSLRTCLARPGRGRLVDGLTASECGSPDVCAPPSSPVCPGFATEAPWEAPYTSAISASSTVCKRAWGADAGVLVPGSTRVWSPVNDMHLGQLGPQPGGSGCPTCQLRVSSSVLYFELTDAFEPEAVFRDARLVIMDRDKNPLEWVPVSDGRVWAPGEVGKLRIAIDEGLARSLEVGEYTAAFDIEVTSRESEERPVRLVSPLAIIP